MGELIKLTGQNIDQVLLTQRHLDELKYGDLLIKADRGRWQADPPVILSRMPVNYQGQFRFHLYNGTHRFAVAAERGIELNGLVVSSAVDIPEKEGIKRHIDGLTRVWEPDERLIAGLSSFLAMMKAYEAGEPMRRPTPLTPDLNELLAELQRQEAAGLLPLPHPRLSL